MTLGSATETEVTNSDNFVTHMRATWLVTREVEQRSQKTLEPGPPPDMSLGDEIVFFFF
jgi:hypothetical protein